MPEALAKIVAKKLYIMRKLFYGLIAIVVFGLVGNAQSPLKIGIVKAGEFIITEDISTIKSEWDALLASQKISSEINIFEINMGTDTELNNEIYYYLLGSNSENNAKVTCFLELSDDTFYISEASIIGGTCTCTGCAYACNPQRIRGIWTCTSGCGNNCTKSVTVSGGTK